MRLLDSEKFDFIIADDQYDFLLSSHSLEHCANTLKTVLEWKRVVKPGGAVLIVTPDKTHTFDHRREVTPFAHLLADYQAGVDEHDLTHLEEILCHHDVSRDAGVKNIEHLGERSRLNYTNRCLHHHVFDQGLLEHTLRFAGVEPLFGCVYKPIHTILLGRV